MNEINKKEITAGKYSIVTFESVINDTPQYFAKVFNNNAKKAYNRLKKFYRFSSISSRDKYVQDTVTGIAKWEQRKKDRRLARKNFVNPAKIGDLLVCAWGYDQTNVDFYQVVDTTNKGVYLRRIAGKSCEWYGPMSDHVRALKDCFVKDAPKLYRRVQPMVVKDMGSYYINMTSYASAIPTNEQEKHYRSWYA